MKLIVRVLINHILTYIKEKILIHKNEFLRIFFCKYIEVKWTKAHGVANEIDMRLS